MEMDIDVLRSSYLSDQLDDTPDIGCQASPRSHRDRNYAIGNRHYEIRDRRLESGAPNGNNQFTNQNECMEFRYIVSKSQSSPFGLSLNQNSNFDRNIRSENIFKDGENMMFEEADKSFEDMHKVSRECYVGRPNDASMMWSSPTVVREPMSYVTQSDDKDPRQSSSNPGHPLTSLFQFCDSLDLDNRHCGDKLAETCQGPVLVDSQEQLIFNVSTCKSWRQNMTSRKSLPYAPQHLNDKSRIPTTQNHAISPSRSWHRPAQFLTMNDSATAQKSRLFDVSIRRTRNASSTDSHVDGTYNKENQPKSTSLLETVDSDGPSEGESENSNLKDAHISIIKCDESQQYSGSSNSTTSDHIPCTIQVSRNRQKFGRCIESDKARRRKYILDSVETVELEPQGKSYAMSQLSEAGRVEEENHRVEESTIVLLHLPPSFKDDTRLSSSFSRGSPEEIADGSNRDSLTDFYDLISAFERSPKKVHSNLSQRFPALKSALGYPNACLTTSDSSVLDSGPNFTESISSGPNDKNQCKHCKKCVSRRAFKRHMQQSYRCRCGLGFCLLDMLNKHQKTCSPISW